MDVVRTIAGEVPWTVSDGELPTTVKRREVIKVPSAQRMDPVSTAVEIAVAQPEGKKKKKPLEPWSLYWTDRVTPPNVYAALKASQKVNHIPGMPFLFTDAALFTQSLKKMRKAFYLDYNIFPKTWLWPLESDKVKAQYERRNNVFIVKE